MKNPIVLFHDQCLDGFTAAWVAHRFYGNEADYVPCLYQQPPPDVRGRHVLILDFSYPRETLVAMRDDARSILVLDHHMTAQEDLRGLDFCIFDQTRSGAGLAWDYLFGKDSKRDIRVPRPWLVDYVEDRDLWRFALPGSREMNAFVSSFRQAFDEWDRLASTLRTDARVGGAAVQGFIDRYVAEMSAQARIVSFEGHDVPVVNAPYINVSELAGALAEGHPFAVAWFQRPDGRYKYSLRSRGGFDVSVIARKYGGGGHKASASFDTKERVV